MPTPGKSAEVLEEEKRSHRTKSELGYRKAAEKAALSGVEFKERAEVKANKIAHKEFLRISKIFGIVGKNDALYEPIINRYCQIQAECQEFEEKREQFYKNIIDLEEKSSDIVDKEMTWTEYYRLMDSFEKQVIAIDKQIQTKRKMLMDIEKENGMTVASSVRTIPKKATKKKSVLEQALSG